MKISKKEKIQQLTEYTKDYDFFINNVSFSDGNEKIISDITLTLNRGETFILVGPSGSGKTTLLKLIFGLLYPTEGEVFIRGYNTHTASTEELQNLMKEMEIVFQYGSLISNMNVYDNLALMNRYYVIRTEDELEKEINIHLEYFGILQRKMFRPAQLTMTESKSASFCRILLNESKIVFIDDPFSGLDEITSRKVLSMLKKFKKEKRTLVISVTDIDFGYDFSDKIGLIDGGKLVFFGTPDELKRNNEKQIKDLIKRISRQSEEAREDKEAE